MTEANATGVDQRPEQTEKQIELVADAAEYLRDVIDPELGVNVIDLGLVYDMWIEEDEKTKAVINMTLTSPACPLTDMIEEQADMVIRENLPIDEVVINWVWMPPWGPQMINDEGRDQLRALGFAV